MKVEAKLRKRDMGYKLAVRTEVLTGYSVLSTSPERQKG